MSDLFIGVVSHERTRFVESQGPGGLAARIARAMSDRGLACAVVINTADMFSGDVGPDAVQRSLTAQVTLDRRWAAYLERPRGARWWAGYTLRWARRAQQRVRAPDERMITRLLNIEMSHLDLLRKGRDSGAHWVLILEDDADAGNIDDLVDGLIGIMRVPGSQPAYVNISHSFSASELGIRHLLSPAQGVHWEGTDVRTIMSARKPVTNTVCAILYRGVFVSPLIEALDALPTDPVIPIDWKLNLGLMTLDRSGVLRAGDCWQIEPAPISQRSMHGAVSGGSPV